MSNSFCLKRLKVSEKNTLVKSSCARGKKLHGLIKTMSVDVLKKSIFIAGLRLPFHLDYRLRVNWRLQNLKTMNGEKKRI